MFLIYMHDKDVSFDVLVKIFTKMTLDNSMNCITINLC